MKKKKLIKSKTKSWAEKYNTRTEIEVKHLEKSFSDIPENSEMLIATPKVLEDYIKKIKKGKSKNLKEIRSDLAKKYSADYTCPLTTGIFLRIVAEANFEKITNGEDIKNITPFWRAIEPGSSLAKKLSFGEDFLIKMRKEEEID